MAKKPSKIKPAIEPQDDDSEETELEHDEHTSKTRPARPIPAEVSAPAKASCLTFVFLVLAVVITLCVGLLSRDSMMRSLNPWWFIAVPFLVLIIPIVVYRAVALWMFDEISRFPDIASAWRAGIVELQRHGITISSVPLFLIVGTGNDRLRRNFMNAAEGDFIIDGVPGAGAPLSWYVNSNGIFLFLNDTSWMNAAITLYEVQASALKVGRSMPGDAPTAPLGGHQAARALGTIMPDVRPPLHPQPIGRAELPSDTPKSVDSNPSNAASREKGVVQESELGEQNTSKYLGTLIPGPIGASTSPTANPDAAFRSSTTRAFAKRVSTRLTSQQSSLQLQRLENVCGLLRRYRHPLCPTNGIMTLLPFEMLKAGDQDIAELERAIAADLATIYHELQFRCPVTAVVVGMEQERGFRELMRRIGRDGTMKQRFGQRYDIRSSATVDELRKFTSHLCGTFEDWVYALFRDEEALSHPGNTALYALLCKVRRSLKTRLGNILGNGFGSDSQNNPFTVLFSGCYFAATGPKADRQAFVAGLLSKLYDEQEEIEWTEDALRDNRRRGWLTLFGWLVCGAILLSIAVHIAWKWLVD